MTDSIKGHNEFEPNKRVDWTLRNVKRLSNCWIPRHSVPPLFSLVGVLWRTKHNRCYSYSMTWFQNIFLFTMGSTACRIPCHLFACHWIRIASIVSCFVLQRTPTNENNGGTEWRGIQQLLQHNEHEPNKKVDWTPRNVKRFQNIFFFTMYWHMLFL